MSAKFNSFHVMPCCNISQHQPPAFTPAVQEHAQRFSQYIGRGNPRGAAPTMGTLTSALHLETALWPSSGLLPRKYIPNDALGNSWKAMRVMGISQRFSSQQRQLIFQGLITNFPTRPSLITCYLAEYDDWLLSKIITLRDKGTNPLRRPILPNQNSKPSELASVGLSQKLINIFIKYEFCWQVAGMWNGNASFAYNPPQIANLSQFACGLHAPIDAILIQEIMKLPVGQHLMRIGLLDRPISPRIKQSSDGQSRPWTKLDCLRSYFGFQLVLRRIAIETWPSGCACNSDVIANCARWFEEKFPSEEVRGKSKDWLKIALETPDKVFKDTVGSLKTFHNRQRKTTRWKKISNRKLL